MAQAPFLVHSSTFATEEIITSFKIISNSIFPLTATVSISIWVMLCAYICSDCKIHLGYSKLWRRWHFLGQEDCRSMHAANISNINLFILYNWISLIWFECLGQWTKNVLWPFVLLYFLYLQWQHFIENIVFNHPAEMMREGRRGRKAGWKELSPL